MDTTTFLMLMIGLLVLAAAMIYGIWLYLERSKSDRIKSVRKESSMSKENEAYNTVKSTKSIKNIMKRKGKDVGNAEMLLERAEMALDADNFSKAEELADDAKQEMETAGSSSGEMSSGMSSGMSSEMTGEMADKTTEVSGGTDEAYTIEDLDKAPPMDENIDGERVEEMEEQREKIEDLPDNYLEAKFEIGVARELVDNKGNPEAEELLETAEEKYNMEEFTDALRYSIKCKKAIDEEEAGLLGGQKLEGEEEKEREEAAVGGMEEVETGVEEKRGGAKKEVEVEFTCQECGSPVSREDKFCNQCGAKIEITMDCPECGAEVDAQHNYCSSCGSELRPTVYECPECGIELEEDVSFCPNCGLKFS